ncbi:MAG: DUF1772 domain-containing protein [Pseudonocardia sp.]|nr:DUF1772 domain-containing protein [Pseudonocardia sp.]
MSLRSWQLVTLLPATLTMGLTAGVFGDWAHTIMRGLGTTDDRTFVGAFQALDRAITNPLFMLTLMGALAFTGVAVVLYRRDDDHSVLPWVALAFGLHLAAFVITMAVHEPLNGVLRAAGDPDRIANFSAVRDAFHETRWVAWHLVRTIATTAAFGCLAWALVLHGRATADPAGHEAPRSARAVPPSTFRSDSVTGYTHSGRPATSHGRTGLTRAAATTVAALVVATAGVVVQMIAGVDFPTVPPVLFILLIPAALVYFGRWRWAAIPAVLAGLFLTIGLFLSGESVRLFDTGLQGGAPGSVGLLAQTVAVAVAAVAGAVTTAQRYRGA